MAARAGRLCLLRLVVAVFVTVSVNASSDGFTEESTVNGDESINGQQSPPRSHLVGRVGEFEGELNYYLPLRLRAHPERVNLVTRPLGFPLSTARLANVFLHFFHHLPSDNSHTSSSSSNQIAGSVSSAFVDSASEESGSASEESGSGESEWAVKLDCHGPPCPAFGSCTARFPNVQACWNPELVDPPMSEPIPPINCPLKADSAGRGDGSRSQARFDEACSHEQDVGIHGAHALQMMRLEDVYLTDNGFALNRTHLFVRNGCPHFPGAVTYDAGHMVHELPAAVFNWAHQPSNNFYHFLIEIFPLFLVAAPLMPSPLRQLPVLVRGGQVQMYEQLGAPLIGIPLDQMRLLPTSGNDLFHANVVYQPIFQNCHHPSQSLWQMMRRRHLLHPSGIPLFNPDWTLRNHRPLSPHEARSLPPDWVVVLAKRLEGKPRAMLNFGEVEAEVVRRFGRERVVVFDGSLPILQARVLFLRACLYIASHGAGFTNMIFMPEKASVLEIRPHRCPTHVFNGLAAACSLRYHLVFSQGVCSSSVVANVTSVARVLVAVRAKFQAEDGGGEGRGPNTIFSRT